MHSWISLSWSIDDKKYLGSQRKKAFQDRKKIITIGLLPFPSSRET